MSIALAQTIGVFVFYKSDSKLFYDRSAIHINPSKLFSQVERGQLQNQGHAHSVENVSWDQMGIKLNYGVLETTSYVSSQELGYLSLSKISSLLCHHSWTTVSQNRRFSNTIAVLALQHSNSPCWLLCFPC